MYTPGKKIRGNSLLVSFFLFALIFSIFAILLMPIAEISGQEVTYEPLAPLPGTTTDGGEETTWQTYIRGAFILAIGIAGVLAVIMITVGGLQYMTTDAVSGKEEGKDTITKAVLGLLLALASVLILWTINPNIISLELNPDPPSSWFVETQTAKPQWPAGSGCVSPETVISYDSAGSSLEECQDQLAALGTPPDCMNYQCGQYFPPPSPTNFPHGSYHWPSAPSGYTNVFCSTNLSECESVVSLGIDNDCDPLPQTCQSFYGESLYCTTYGYCPPPGDDGLPTEGYYAIHVRQWTHESNWPWAGSCELPVVNDDVGWVPEQTFSLDDYDSDTQALSACNSYINNNLPHLEPSNCYYYQCVHSDNFPE